MIVLEKEIIEASLLLDTEMLLKLLRLFVFGSARGGFNGFPQTCWSVQQISFFQYGLIHAISKQAVNLSAMALLYVLQLLRADRRLENIRPPP